MKKSASILGGLALVTASVLALAGCSGSPAQSGVTPAAATEISPTSPSC
ncbi:hypothetical protein L2X99_17410 [Microbacterium sp. KUDC0406]|nr:hypothetical protein [Microbacterium sp. KUDC0406]UJP10102.1 hypothetical protein L2X99_17410 [Microbacterium sp. KUDC0406]